MREWNDVEFNGAEDIAPHLRPDGSVEHASLLGAMTRTESGQWSQIASPNPARPYQWFACPAAGLVGRVEDEARLSWTAHVFDAQTAEELATLCVPLDLPLAA
jgi:hypothetical protein